MLHLHIRVLFLVVGAESHQQHARTCNARAAESRSVLIRGSVHVGFASFGAGDVLASVVRRCGDAHALEMRWMSKPEQLSELRGVGVSHAAVVAAALRWRANGDPSPRGTAATTNRPRFTRSAP